MGGLTLPDMRVWRAAPLIAAVVMTACSPQSGEAVTSTTAALSGTTTAPTTTLPLVAGCPDEGEFTEGGEVGSLDHPGSDADIIGLITWTADEACETFTLTFETSEGAPATTPPSVGVRYLDVVPVIRLSLNTEATVITDQLVETPMVERLYVVRALDGGMFIDIHLAAPAQARFSVERSPAVLVLDLQPGIVDYPVSAAFSDHAVAVTPADGATANLPVEVSGYARTFESNVLIIATVGDEVVAEVFTTAADSLETWGEFRAELLVPTGDISLFVGEENQEQGGLEGVTISLTVQ